MDKLVYALCIFTSLVSALLLGRGYLRTRIRLLLWSAICFSFLTLSNCFVYLDLVAYPAIDLRPVRDLLTFCGLGVLITGMIKETV